ncbi:MAG: hypothetical protein ACPGJU_07400 [Coraliomargarita sp.]
MKVLAVIVVALLLFLQLWTCSQEDSSRDGPETVSEEDLFEVPEDPLREFHVRREQSGKEQRKETLNEMRTYRERQQEALKEMPYARERIFRTSKEQLLAILERHGEEYEELRKLAATKPDKVVDCTICEGDTYLDYCIYCEEDAQGVCVRCGGSGERGVRDELCPPCLGTGECYACTGSGMMFCPFCDDGAVDLQFPPPYESMDLD